MSKEQTRFFQTHRVHGCGFGCGRANLTGPGKARMRTIGHGSQTGVPTKRSKPGVAPTSGAVLPVETPDVPTFAVESGGWCQGVSLGGGAGTHRVCARTGGGCLGLQR